MSQTLHEHMLHVKLSQAEKRTRTTGICKKNYRVEKDSNNRRYDQLK